MLNTRPAELLPRLTGSPVEWRVADGLTGYEEAVTAMDATVAAISAGGSEQVWLVEHPPLYTAGTSAKPEDLLDARRFPVHASGRGGQYTYHGPGQRVAYVMLDLSRRGPDLRAFVATLEEWLISSVAAFGIEAERRDGRVGLWVRRPERGPGAEGKIAAIGIRVRRWVSFHGVALNVSPELSHYDGIVPCGVRDQGVTSLADLGARVTMAEVDRVLHREFERLFGPTA